MTRRLRDFLTIFALIAALLPMGADATPVDTTDGPEAVMQSTLLRLLNAESAEKQERAARRIRAYAHTHRYDEAFFQDLVQPLHDVVSNGRTTTARITAVSALSAIGTDVAMVGLQAQKDELDSDRLRQAVEVAFDRYAATHIDDVKRAQVIE